MKLRHLAFAMAAAAAGLCGSAHATLLLPGGGPSAVDILASPPGGTLLASEAVPVTTPHWTGTLRSAVMSSGGGLDFYYQITNASTSTDAIGRVAGADFAPVFTTSVFQTASVFDGFVAGTQAASSADRGTLGVVGFNFEPGANGTGKVDPGESSDILIVRTNAAAFTNGFAAVTDGTAASVSAYMPAAPVPEPGTLALIGSGCLALALRRRRRS